MNNEDTPAREPRVVESSGLQVRFTIDEDGRIMYSVLPDERLQGGADAPCLELVQRGAPFTLAATSLLANELFRNVLNTVLERTEMRFRRAGRWEEIEPQAPKRLTLAETVAGEDDCVH